MQQFWSAGFAATSVNELVAATGLGKGSLYGAFGGKRDLFGRALQRYCEQVVKASREDLVGDEAGAAGRLRAYILAALPRESETEHRACFLSCVAAELGASDPEARQEVRGAFEQLRDVLEATLIQARRAGDIPADLRPRSAANGLLAALRGVEALLEAGVDIKVLEDAVEVALKSVELQADDC